MLISSLLRDSPQVVVNRQILRRSSMTSSSQRSRSRRRSSSSSSFLADHHHWFAVLLWIAIALAPAADCQDLNTPPVILVDRNWRIRENMTVGTLITQVRADDADNDELEFGLDPLKPGQLQPFRIDPNTGYVYLNDSIEGKGGQNFFVYITVTDGLVTSKNEVYVNILSQNATGVYKTRGSQFTPGIDSIRKLLPAGFPLNIPQAPPPPPPFPPRPTTPLVVNPPTNQKQPSVPSTTKQTKTYPDPGPDSDTSSSTERPAVTTNGSITRLTTDASAAPASPAPSEVTPATTPSTTGASPPVRTQPAGDSNSLTSFVPVMYQVARGMDFLTSRGIIHRDLAARNILITDDHTCKVADFGFARDIVTSKVYERKSEGRLPIRWMATESLYDNIFTVKSDIWSFGILMWEIVTLGSTPYPGIAAADVMRKVRDGYRLEKPEHCRRELYNIMFYCWAKDPNERPDFPECVEMLDRLLQTETDYIELERFPDHNYYNMLNLSGEKL